MGCKQSKSAGVLSSPPPPTGSFDENQQQHKKLSNKDLKKKNSKNHETRNQHQQSSKQRSKKQQQRPNNHDDGGLREQPSNTLTDPALTLSSSGGSSSNRNHKNKLMMINGQHQQQQQSYNGSDQGKEQKNLDLDQYDNNQNDIALLYKLLVDCVLNTIIYDDIIQQPICDAITKQTAEYCSPTTKSTPLHIAVQLLDQNLVQDHPTNNNTTKTTTTTNHHPLVTMLDKLIRAAPMNVALEDKYGNIPLHYAISPTIVSTTKNHNTNTTNDIKKKKKKNVDNDDNNNEDDNDDDDDTDDVDTSTQISNLYASYGWKTRTAVVRLLLAADKTTKSYDYLQRNNVVYKRRFLSSPTTSTTLSTSPLHFQNVMDMDIDLDNGGCSPLYRVVQTIPDDYSITNPPTYEYIYYLLHYIQKMSSSSASSIQNSQKNSSNHEQQLQSQLQSQHSICCYGYGGNDSDGDVPLSLLYRRFTRQFDLAEKFFAGDNSRFNVLAYRNHYKQAASNTWKIIDLFVQNNNHQHHHTTSTNNQKTTIPSSSVTDHAQQDTESTNLDQLVAQSQQNQQQYYSTLHKAVQGETPPDLLRYIVETNSEDLMIRDEHGNLPLHYAAMVRTNHHHQNKSTSTTTTSETTDDHEQQQHNNKISFPAFYSKYVIDELLYKYPQAASIPDTQNGYYPLTLAMQSGKMWYGGGIKSLYDAYPEAVQQLNPIECKQLLARVLSNETSQSTNTNNETYNDDDPNDTDSQVMKFVNSNGTIDLIQDDFHDAIMLIQQENVDVSEVVAIMWANEEDAGVQMLGCVAISRLIKNISNNHKNNNHNNSNNHNNKKKQEQLNDSIDIQTMATTTLTNTMSTSTIDDLMRIALSSIPAVVNAMKAHPNEVIVQEKACDALKRLAWSDGKREISFVASGAVAAIIGAMQAHVSDPGVQEEACAAVSRIVHYGGPDRATVVASVSGLTAILNSLAAHPNVMGVQLHGCRALNEFSYYRSPPTSLSSNSGVENDDHGNGMPRIGSGTKISIRMNSANLPEIPRLQTQPLLEYAKKNFPHECGELVNMILPRLS